MEKEQRSLARLLGWSGRWKGLTLFGVSLAFISAALALMPYIFVYLCVDEILSGSVGGASKWGWAALWTAVANTVCYISALMCTHIAAFHTARNIRIMALDHVRKLPLGWFMTHSTGQVRKTIDYNSSLTEDVLAHKLADTAASALTPIVAIVLLFVFSPLMGLATLATMALSILAMASMMGGAHKGFYMRYQKELEKMSSEAVEYVRLIPVLKTFNQSVMSFKAFWKTIKDNGDAALEYALSCRKGQTAFLTLINSTFALLIPIALVLAGDGDVMGTLSSFIFYSIFAPACGSLMYRLMYASESVMKLTLAVDSISSLLEVGQMEEGAITDTGDGTLTFSHVSFSYPGREGKAVDDLSFTLEKGKLTALVGPSGSGKSRTFWQWQEHGHTPRLPLLGPGCRKDKDRWRRHLISRARGPACRHLDSLPGRHTDERHHPGEHQARPFGSKRRGGPQGRTPGMLRRLRPRPPGWLRHRAQRERLLALRRREAAHLDRPRHPQGCSNHPSGRGDGQSGHGEREPHPGCPLKPPQGTDGACGRTPTEDSHGK